MPATVQRRGKSAMMMFGLVNAGDPLIDGKQSSRYVDHDPMLIIRRKEVIVAAMVSSIRLSISAMDISMERRTYFIEA
jgi:hypothetical protein